MSVRWIGLEINRGPPVEKQVDDIVKTFETLYKQAEQRRVPNIGQVVKAVKLLRPSIIGRITELENFYRSNDVDPRSARFEASRVKLKRLIMNCPELSEEDPQLPQAGAPIAVSGSSLTPGGSNGHTSIAMNASAMQRLAAPSTPPATQGAGNLASSGSAGRKGTSPVRSSNSVVVRVIMTHEEYEDVKLRRDALRQMMVLSTASAPYKS
jgi:hypothetical protein